MTSEHNGVLAGRRAVVTGAGRGLGRRIALALAAAGADVAVTARTVADLEPLAAEIAGHGAAHLALPADVTDPAQVARLAEAVGAAWGGVDILVNNAGTAASHKFGNPPRRSLAPDVAGQPDQRLLCDQSLRAAMIAAGGGRIVIIASTAARVGDRYVAAYTAAKHGVLGLTRALAVELVPAGHHGQRRLPRLPGYPPDPDQHPEHRRPHRVERTGSPRGAGEDESAEPADLSRRRWRPWSSFSRRTAAGASPGRRSTWTGGADISVAGAPASLMLGPGSVRGSWGDSR